MLPKTSKEKSARVHWGYHARQNPIARTRGWLWLFAAAGVTLPLLVVTALSAVTGDVPNNLAASASRGPVASVHAGWDQQCEACHHPFRPIHGDSWASRLFANPLGFGETGDTPAHNRLGDQKCEACHLGPRHHNNMKAADQIGCAECHRDHRGRDASLVRLADGTCTVCHTDLQAHRQGSEPSRFANSITNFAEKDGHPEFRAVTQQTQHERTLKFSHAVHMAPGLELGEGFSFEQIHDEKERKRYMALLGVSDPKQVVQLNCQACHQLDASRTDGVAGELSPEEQFAAMTRSILHGLPREPLQPPRAAGAYYLPINFEMHCQACHPLTFDESAGLQTRQAPHRVQPDELNQFLTEVYSARWLNDQLQADDPPKRGTPRLDPRVREEARSDIERQVFKAQETLYIGRKTCQECHMVELPEAGELTSQTDPRFPKRILPVDIPTVWQPSAKFDHSAHRAMNCVDCHPKAYTSTADETAAAVAYSASQQAFPRYQHPPDLPSIDLCRQCHAPASTDENRVRVAGVRHNCTDCHFYHHADRTLQGVGAPARGAKQPLSLEALLRAGD